MKKKAAIICWYALGLTIFAWILTIIILRAQQTKFIAITALTFNVIMHILNFAYSFYLLFMLDKLRMAKANINEIKIYLFLNLIYFLFFFGIIITISGSNYFNQHYK